MGLEGNDVADVKSYNLTVKFQILFAVITIFILLIVIIAFVVGKAGLNDILNVVSSGLTY